MVKRYSLGKNKEQLAKRLGTTMDSKFKPIFNAAPQLELPIITNERPDKISWFRWGLMTYDSVDAQMGDKLLNARIETIRAKAPFADLVESKRCLVPADGFFLWEQSGDEKPFYFHRDDNSIFTIAGIWDSWKDEYDESVTFNTFSMITVESPAKIKGINDRMPAILPEELEKEWLKKGFKSTSMLDKLKVQHADMFDFHPTSSKVNNIKNNTRDILRRTDGINPGDNLSLFAD